jgi:glycosyltransferase involved in cell wall biosynthesis
MKRYRVLLSAYACEPGRGSEPGVGWNWARHLGREHEVWVLTRANNRRAIEAALAREALPNVRWVYHDLPAWVRVWKRPGWGTRPYYYVWQLSAADLARRLCRQTRFDLVQHVTFVNYWMPSLGALLGLPFVWGPVGGGESAPPAFYRTLGFKGGLRERARDAVRRLARCDPFVHRTANRATLALATTPDTAGRLRGLGVRRVLPMGESALPEDEVVKLGCIEPSRGGRFRVLSSGNLIALKGFHLALHAFARLARADRDSEYWIAGDGPQRRRLEQLALSLGIESRVRFWGALPREEALGLLKESDVLVHPSLHDSGGWVCVEAMAAGRPVLCLDLGGPGQQVTDETGIRVRASEPEEAIDELAKGLASLRDSGDLRARLGAGGRKRVAEFYTWNGKVRSMMTLWSEVLRAEVP